jgi:hypothetical protein
MNIQEEFEKWHLEHFGEEPRYSDYRCPEYTYDGQMIRSTWNACAELMQKEVDSRDAIIKRLIRVYIVDDQEYDPESRANKVFERYLKEGL